MRALRRLWREPIHSAAGAATLTATTRSANTLGCYRRPKMKAVLRVAGAFALALPAMVTTLAATAEPARACSCSGAPLSEYADEVTVAFVGTQVSRTTYEEDIADFTLRRAVMVLEVEWVYKGEVGPRIEIHSNADGPACGIAFSSHSATGVVAFERRGRLRAGACDNPVGIDKLEEVFGASRPPDSSISLQSSGDTAPPSTAHTDSARPASPIAPQTRDVAAQPPAVPADSTEAETATESPAPDEDADPSLPLLLVVGLILVAIGFPTFWLLVSRRSTRRSAAAAETPEGRV